MAFASAINFNFWYKNIDAHYVEVYVLQIIVPGDIEVDINQEDDIVEMVFLHRCIPIARITAEKVFKIFRGDDVSTCKIRITQIHFDLAVNDLSFRVSGLPIEAQTLSFEKE